MAGEPRLALLHRSSILHVSLCLVLVLVPGPTTTSTFTVWSHTHTMQCTHITHHRDIAIAFVCGDCNTVGATTALLLEPACTWSCPIRVCVCPVPVFFLVLFFASLYNPRSTQLCPSFPLFFLLMVPLASEGRKARHCSHVTLQTALYCACFCVAGLQPLPFLSFHWTVSRFQIHLATFTEASKHAQDMRRGRVWLAGLGIQCVCGMGGGERERLCVFVCLTVCVCALCPVPRVSETSPLSHW